MIFQKTIESAKTLSDDVEVMPLKQSIISLGNSLKESNDLSRDLKEEILEVMNLQSFTEIVTYIQCIIYYLRVYVYNVLRNTSFDYLH